MPPTPAGARRLSGAERAVVIIAVLLVVAFVVMAAWRLSGTGSDASAGATPTPPAAPPTATSPEPTESPEPGGEDLSGVTFDFVTPSGNIACTVEDDRALCGIASYQYAVPAEADAACEGTVGNFLQVTAQGASLVCDTSGRALSIDAGAIPVLAYGEQARENGFTCDSTEEGVTCTHDASGHAFTVRRAEYALS